MTKDERMDEVIRGLADEAYNPPPPTPREDMWRSIRAARSAPAAAPVEEAPGADVLPFRRRAARWGWRALPVAALLLLSFGLGRLSSIYQRHSRLATSSAPTPSATAPVPAPVTAAPRPVSEPATPAPRVADADRQAGRVRAEPEPARARTARREAVPAPRSRPDASIYRFAAAQTLGQAELLLTSFRAETRTRGAVDPQLAEWAGDVLASTRLLLDSPAARDPKTRGLLEDLELVLAQIVQLRGAGPGRADDAQLIDHALQQRDVLPRLRTAVPAGGAVGI